MFDLSGAASTAGNWLSSVGDYAVDAFSWLDQNPSAANILGGVAAGVGQAYLQNEQAEDDRAFQQQMYERRRRDSMATPGEVGDYGSYTNSLTKGLLSNGKISGG